MLDNLRSRKYEQQIRSLTFQVQISIEEDCNGEKDMNANLIITDEIMKLIDAINSKIMNRRKSRRKQLKKKNNGFTSENHVEQVHICLFIVTMSL